MFNTSILARKLKKVRVYPVPDPVTFSTGPHSRVVADYAIAATGRQGMTLGLQGNASSKAVTGSARQLHRTQNSWAMCSAAVAHREPSFYGPGRFSWYDTVWPCSAAFPQQ